jgi:hypothetical protein
MAPVIAISKTISVTLSRKASAVALSQINHSGHFALLYKSALPLYNLFEVH